VYKVCDCCNELFFKNEDHEYFEGFGVVCFLCLDEGFDLLAHSDKKDVIRLTSQKIPSVKFPRINLNS